MEPRRVGDRWWMIILAFIAAAAMVMLVLLTETDQAVGTSGTRPPATSSGHSRSS
jgi:hypothetical protein